MLLLALFVSAALVVIAAITILNVITFPRLGRFLRSRRFQSLRQVEMPLVSVLIPARNEAERLPKTVQALLSQAYPHFEVLILDDHSTDRTTQAALEAAGGDPRLRVFPGANLPQGWLGKNWACHQLANVASGDWLLFTDADVGWHPQALQALVRLAQVLEADLLTVWPTQYALTWGERLVIPLMALTVIGYLPLWAVYYVPGPIFAAANGQCMLFRRRAYQAIGGHAAVRSQIIEDIQLSRQIKRHGFQLCMADGDGLISCRMYNGWGQVRDGFAKNILAGYGGRVIFLILAAIFHWLVFLFPWFWLALGGFFPQLNAGLPWFAWSLSLILAGVVVRMLTAAVTRQRLWDGWLMPVSTLLMTRIALQAIWWQWRYGGPLWKGRVIKV